MHRIFGQNPLNRQLSQWEVLTAVVVTGLSIGLFAAGGYYFQAASETVAYSLFGAGVLIPIGSLIYFAINSCKKVASNEIKTPPAKPIEVELPKEEEEKSHSGVALNKTQESDVQVPKGDRPPLILDQTVLENPKRALLRNYCDKVADEAAKAAGLLNARGQEPGDDGTLGHLLAKYLSTYGQQAGDYLLMVIREVDFYNVFYLDEKMDVQIAVIHDPEIYDRDVYNKVYEKIRYPIFPFATTGKLNPAGVHSTMMAYKAMSLKPADS